MEALLAIASEKGPRTRKKKNHLLPTEEAGLNDSNQSPKTVQNALPNLNDQKLQNGPAMTPSPRRSKRVTKPKLPYGAESDDEPAELIRVPENGQKQVRFIEDHSTLNVYDTMLYAYDCYCSSGTCPANTVLLQCSSCNKWFHKDCVEEANEHSFFPGESNYIFECKSCGTTEKFEKRSKTWNDIIRTAIYNLCLTSKDGTLYFHWRNEICTFMDNNWSPLCNGKSRTPTWWNTVVSQLSQNRHIFLGSGDGHWSLQRPESQRGKRHSNGFTTKSSKPKPKKPKASRKSRSSSDAGLPSPPESVDLTLHSRRPPPLGRPRPKPRRRKLDPTDLYYSEVAEFEGMSSPSEYEDEDSDDGIQSYLCHRDSPLSKLDITKIVNTDVFKSLTDAEKQELTQYLPPLEKDNSKISQVFENNLHFTRCLHLYQQMLLNGDFDPGYEEYRNYQAGKRRREQHDVWKEDNYEEFWGEQLIKSLKKKKKKKKRKRKPKPNRPRKPERLQSRQSIPLTLPAGAHQVSTTSSLPRDSLQQNHQPLDTQHQQHPPAVSGTPHHLQNHSHQSQPHHQRPLPQPHTQHYQTRTQTNPIPPTLPSHPIRPGPVHQHGWQRPYDTPFGELGHPGAAAAQDEHTGTMSCICSDANLEYGIMIQCDQCTSWLHGPCVGIEQEADIPTVFACPRCRSQQIHS